MKTVEFPILPFLLFGSDMHVSRNALQEQCVAYGGPEQGCPYSQWDLWC